jgi:4-hydroxy-tetrahydrodipicolinate synthase
LCDEPNIVAIKDATGNLVRGGELIAKVGQRLAVLSGDDGTAFPLYAIGARGVISVVSNVAPREMAEMWDAAAAGDWAKARAVHFKLRHMNQLLFEEPSPAPTKAALALLGRCSTDIRLPLVAASQAMTDKIRAEMHAQGML